MLEGAGSAFKSAMVAGKVFVVVVAVVVVVVMRASVGESLFEGPKKKKKGKGKFSPLSVPAIDQIDLERGRVTDG